MILQSAPKIFQIEITSVCNMKCNFCPHPRMLRDKRHMEPEIFSEASRYFRSGQHLGLYMMGDPLLCPNFFDFVDISKRKGCLPEIATNSLALKTSEFRRRVLKAGLHYIILDMTVWKESASVMGKALGNIQAFLEDYSSMSASVRGLPTIALQIVTDIKNQQDFPDFVAEHVRFQPHKILLKRKFLDTWAGQMPRHYDRTEIAPPKIRRPCQEPFNRVAILQNGDVVPCCRDAHGSYVYGNIMEEPLEAIWASPKAESLRKIMLDSRDAQLPHPCKTCKEWHIPMDRHVSTQDGSDAGTSNTKIGKQ